MLLSVKHALSISIYIEIEFNCRKHLFTQELKSDGRCFLVAAKDNSTATTDSRGLQAANGGGVSSSSTAGAALAALLAGYLLLLVPEMAPSSF